MLKDVVSTLRKSHDCSLEARLLVDRDAVDVVRSVLPLTLIVVWPSTLRDSLINWASLSVRLALLVLRRRRVVLGAAAFTALSVLSVLRQWRRIRTKRLQRRDRRPRRRGSRRRPPRRATRGTRETRETTDHMDDMVIMTWDTERVRMRRRTKRTSS